MDEQPPMRLSGSILPQEDITGASTQMQMQFDDVTNVSIGAELVGLNLRDDVASKGW